jgi:hypothetical protein
MEGEMNNFFSAVIVGFFGLLYFFGLYVIIVDDYRYTTKDVVIAAVVFPYPWWVGGKEVYRFITTSSEDRVFEKKCLETSEAIGLSKNSRLRYCECLVETKNAELCKSKIFVSDTSRQSNNQNRQNPFESLNSYELDKFSRVMAAAGDKPLNESDLGNIRAALKSYVDRTGNFLTQNDIDMFVRMMKKSDNYQYEMMQSLLYSWDKHQPYTTNRFEELYKEMQQDGVRKPSLLQSDRNRIQEAAKNQSYTEDADGKRYEFSRELILENLDKVNMSRMNMDKIVGVYKEFVR